jgi:hypothetical protein
MTATQITRINMRSDIQVDIEDDTGGSGGYKIEIRRDEQLITVFCSVLDQAEELSMLLMEIGD